MCVNKKIKSEVHPKPYGLYAFALIPDIRKSVFFLRVGEQILKGCLGYLNHQGVRRKMRILRAIRNGWNYGVVKTGT
jgi:hypothetical protein